jgi:hypothetical protein
MNMFEEIDKIKEELPKVNTISREIGKLRFNGYQKIAIGLGIFVVIMGVIFGNLFPACGNTSSYYSGVCLTTEFNVSVMIGCWLVGFLICLVIYGMGHIIQLLSEISEKLK